jgi:hypothetical protein
MLGSLAACGGGGESGGGNGVGVGSAGEGGAGPPTTSLSCSGYPSSGVAVINGAQQPYTQVCLILQEYAPVTSSVSASTKAGNVTAHGGQTSNAYVVYSRIIAQAADQGAATALAKSVVITTANGTITASPDHVDTPQNLQVDFELFTNPGTNLTLSTDAGDLAADNHDAVLQLSARAGNTSLVNVQGQITATSNVGSINVKLTGTGWTGPGMTASVQTGNISLSRPATYQAAFTAQSAQGTVSIDNQNAMTTTPGTPVALTSGSGAPIVLEATVGSVAVSMM